jgi:hypothetical protein
MTGAATLGVATRHVFCVRRTRGQLQVERQHRVRVRVLRQG